MINPRIAEIPPSLIRSINARKRPGDLDFGLGEPTLRPALGPFEAALEWIRQNGCPYSPNAGLPELRQLVAEYLARSAGGGGAVGADDVCITVGSEEALYLAIKTIVDPARHEVLIVEPCYLAYAKICMLEGIRHRLVPLDSGDGFRPRAATVLEALREETRLVVLNTPSNPTGRVWPQEELQALAEGLSRKEGAPAFILSDEVYRELYYGEAPPPTPAEHYPRTLVAGSLSKSNALTGLRMGWLAGPREVIDGAVKAHQFVNTAAGTFGQRVAIELLREPGSLAAHRAHYVTVRTELLREAGRLGLDLIPPEGAFYAFLRLPPAWRADSLGAAEMLLDRERVVTVPGRAFGDSGEGWLRLSWVTSPQTVVEGVRRIARWQSAAPHE